MKSSDRKLLEQASKAAGYRHFDTLAGDDYANVYDDAGRQSEWNPLIDDGQAFALALKLRIRILGLVTDTAGQSASCVEYNGERTCVLVQGCLVGATRRAIVQVAAQIGRSMS